MKKIVLCALAIVSLLTACNNNIQQGYYSGQDISAKAEILKDSKTKTTQINVDLNSPWKLYAGISTDSIDFSKPVAEGEAGGTFPIETSFYPRRYFQLTTADGNALFTERHLPMDGGYNFRDLGGYPADNGRFVKWGFIFRTDDMQHLTETDLNYLASIGVRTVVDFRSEEEVEAGADILPATTNNHILLPIFPGNMSGMQMSDINPDSFEDLMESMYTSLCTEEKIIDQYRQLFTLLQDETKIPLSFHCSAGKDRTGVGAALFLYSLGVSEDIIMQDYLLSNQYLEGKYAALIAEHPEFKSMGQVKTEYMKIVFDRLKADHGSVESYLKNVLNVDIDKMKSLYLY